jgi:chromosomal replication initiation ATPase DnaA
MSDLEKRLRATTDGATVNPDGPEAAARIAELEAALQKKGCARDQKTTQYCAEVISRDARIVELEAALRQIEYLDRPQVRGLPRRKPIQEIARAALEGGKE